MRKYLFLSPNVQKSKNNFPFRSRIFNKKKKNENKMHGLID